MLNLIGNITGMVGQHETERWVNIIWNLQLVGLYKFISGNNLSKEGIALVTIL